MSKRFIPDTFSLILIGTVIVASLLPATGRALDGVNALSNAAIFALFFFHGLRLSRASLWAGMQQWRLQVTILIFSFVVMPFAGFWFGLLFAGFMSIEFAVGIVFLCALPSTVQSAIAYSSLAKGNVAASLIAAALSNLLGVALTPLVVGVLLKVSGANAGPDMIMKIAMLLLLPFILGQIAQIWLAMWAERHQRWIARMDKLTIVLAVYAAFSAAMAQGIWHRVSVDQLVFVTVAATVLLTFALSATWFIGGALGLPRGDRITLMFSGSHKTLATGAPMARILFPGPEAGLIIIPLMIYHQMQLIISAWIAARLNRAT